MMFFLRALMVALGFFGVVYCLLSLLVACGWRGAALFFRKSAVARARLLFAVRILPLAGSALITLAFALPAFVLLEGGKIDEDSGTILFSVCTLLLIAAGVLRVSAAQARASRVLSDWLEEARSPYQYACHLERNMVVGEADDHVESKDPYLLNSAGATAGNSPQESRRIVPNCTITKQGPPLLLYGVATPQILASESAVAVLTSDELRVAVQHEIGHMHSRDNLKKLLFSATSFPGLGSLEHAWLDAAEFAADETAVSNSGEAVELASALLKLAELAPSPELPAFTTGLVNCADLVRLRVQRLLDWKESGPRGSSSEFQRVWLLFLPPALLTLVYVSAHYSQALLFTHRFTEWFIH